MRLFLGPGSRLIDPGGTGRGCGEKRPAAGQLIGRRRYANHGNSSRSGQTRSHSLLRMGVKEL